ncbi:GNAT family acetyltransferase [Tamlana nanhaiensis]|uniref:GNAT family acetyltransferase n=1 Tax=Neotamlana nanhaiensis TaxID=1382798 RepID=A0A0D7W6V4_9FLAO|nr:GNAT family N-acetyltransferase [Tamlana nanhaiensis]KJD34433.1 GNAT family acetyltransferase [Tamlana nanhaiensis]
MIRIISAENKSDYITIETLGRTIWEHHYTPIIGKAQVDYMLEKYQSVPAITEQVETGYCYYLLNFNQKTVGYIAIKPEVEALFLSKIYVLYDYRGKGIGKSAIQFIEAEAARLNLPKIRLTVNRDNSNSIKAYEKIGFKKTGELVTDIGNGFVMDDLLMAKLV